MNQKAYKAEILILCSRMKIDFLYCNWWVQNVYETILDGVHRGILNFKYKVFGTCFTHVLVKRHDMASITTLYNNDSIFDTIKILLNKILYRKAVAHQLNNSQYLGGLGDYPLIVCKYYDKDVTGSIKPVVACRYKNSYKTSYELIGSWHRILVPKSIAFLTSNKSSESIDVSHEYNAIGRLMRDLDAFKMRDFLEICIVMFNSKLTVHDNYLLNIIHPNGQLEVLQSVYI